MYFEPTHRTLHHPRILRQQNTGFVLKTNGKLCGFFELFTHSSNTKPANQTGIGISMKLAFLMFFIIFLSLVWVAQQSHFERGASGFFQCSNLASWLVGFETFLSTGIFGTGCLLLFCSGVLHGRVFFILCVLGMGKWEGCALLVLFFIMASKSMACNG
jgi:membrane-associated HD superfamily phosphohydrolase